jgi:hypothetical protein
MSGFLMEIYNAESGIEFGLRWNDEQEYLLAQAFLKELVGGPCGRNEYHPDKPEFYYLENNRQRDALLAFQRKLLSGR